MEISVLKIIKENKNMYEFLLNNSIWYKYLNRDSDMINEFIKAYKKYNRDKNITKINKAIENADLITNVIKMIE